MIDDVIMTSHFSG